jgi:Leucine-rich repeat (LRR) protein
MEESDDLSNGPNENGELNLSYYEWQEIPHEVHDQFQSQLFKLSLSHNHLLRISDHIGKLTLLKDLDLSHNRIQFVDASIGKCIRLRRLNLSNNYIQTLPDEICNCFMIETLLLNHNRLTSLPSNFNFPALECLDVGNNDLRSLPLQVCSLVSATVENDVSCCIFF